MAVNRVFPAISTNGGTSGSLDSISISVLTHGDLAVAADNTLNSIHFYRYNSLTSADEDYPTIISPDDVVTSGRWELISPSYFMEDLIVEAGNNILVNEIYGNGSDLQIGYENGVVDISIGELKMTITKDITTNSQIVSTLPIGTAPIETTSTTMCPNLNANFVGGIDPTDIIVRDGSVAFTGVVTGITPTSDEHLTTKGYVDTLVESTDEHDETGGAADSRIHTQYVYADGTRAFTGVVSGITPINTAHLSTKGYVDSEIDSKATNVHIRKDGSVSFTNTPRVVDHTLQTVTANYHLATKYYVDNVSGNQISHGALQNLGVDDHTQYAKLDGVRNFTSPIGYNTGSVVNVAGNDDFVTKSYVDDEVTGITDVYITKDGSVPFTGVPQVSNTAGVPDITPNLPFHIATVGYVSSVVAGGVSHGDLNGLTDDDHEQYSLVNGTRAFTGKVQGVTTLGTDPNETLVTKNYVDDSLSLFSGSHSSLSDLGNDDHTQYIHEDSRRMFDTTLNFPGVDNNGVSPNDSPTQPWDLTTKEYVDAGISTLGTTELFDYVDIYGRHDIVGNQVYGVVYGQEPFIDGRDSELVNKLYVDDYAKRFVVSVTDGNFEYFDAKIETNNTLSVTSIYSGVDTGVVVDKTTELLGGISYTEIVNGGTGFFVYNSDDVSYPQTFATNVFNVAGVGGQSITETQIYPPNNGGGADADIRVDNIVGDVEYIQIINQALSGTTDGTYTFTVTGDTPSSQQDEWSVTVVSDVITSIQRVTAGAGYSYAADITSIDGLVGSFTLRPYILGALTEVSVEDIGSGYTSLSYNLTEATRASFTVSGEGTADLGTLDLTFHNPVNEKLKFSHFISTTTPGTLYADDFTVTSGNIITGLTFDKWGHITQVDESIAPVMTWEQKTANFEGVYGIGYFVDTTGASRTITLPDTAVTAPSVGDTIVIDDYNKNSAVNNITVQAHANDGGSGNLTVEGVVSQDIVVDISAARVTMTYVDASYGWRIKVF